MINGHYTIINQVSEFIEKERIYRVLKPTWGGSGIFSYVWGCLQSIWTYPNDKYYFDMRRFSPYYDPTITHTDNVWEYYFKQPYINTYPESNTIIDIGIWNQHPSAYCHLTDVTEEKRKIYNNIIKKNIILLPHIKNKINEFVSKHNMDKKKILGVHYRGNNTSFDCAYPNPPERYINEIKNIEKDYELIFVISDDSLFIKNIHNIFGNKVLSYDAVRPVVDDRNEMITNVEHGYKLKEKYLSGEGAIIDSYLLSYSKFIICPYSNVSTFSHYLNLDCNFVDIDLLYGNIKK